MALPVILINSATGSDTTSSGAGPGDGVSAGAKLSGTANASTDGTGLIVTLPAGTDLTNVAVDGSHVVFISDATSGARNFGKITAKAGSGGATPTVTVSNAFGLSLTNKDWAVGGKRASVAGTTSSKLLTQGGGTAGDAMPGWIIRMESGHDETTATFPAVRRSGDQTDGEITLEGEAGAATMPIIRCSNNGNAVAWSGAISYTCVQNFELKNTNATKTASVGIAVNTTGTGIRITGMRVSDTANKFWKAIAITGNVNACAVYGNDLGNTASHVFDATAGFGAKSYIRANRIHDGGGAGVNFANGGAGTNLDIQGNEILNNALQGIAKDAGAGNIGIFKIDRNTIKGNLGDGISIALTSAQPTLFACAQITNNIIANNGTGGVGWGINFSGAGMSALVLSSVSAFVDYNAVFGNAQGGCNLAGVNANGSTLDPQFVSATDLRVGDNIRGTGYPTSNKPGQSYRSYVTPGANEPSSAQPAVTDVRLGTVYGDGVFTGTFAPAPVGKVRSGFQYGAGGTEFTGTDVSPPVNVVVAGTVYGDSGEFVGTFAVDYPAVGDVRLGVSYNLGASVGTLSLPAVTDVKTNVQYGAGGTEFTGTYGPIPAVAGRTTGYLTVYDADGAIAAGVDVELAADATEDDSVGLALSGDVRTETSDAGGLVQFTDLFLGASYRIRRGLGSVRVTIPSTAGATYALPSLVGG